MGRCVVGCMCVIQAMHGLQLNKSGLSAKMKPSLAAFAFSLNGLATKEKLSFPPRHTGKKH